MAKKKVTIASLGKGVDCLIKNTCNQIDLSEIEKSLASIDKKMGGEDGGTNGDIYKKIAEYKQYIDNIETLLGEIKDKPNPTPVNLTPIETALGDIKTYVDNVESKLNEIIGKTEVVEVKGCFEKEVNLSTNNIDKKDSSYRKGFEVRLKGEDTYFKGSDIIAFYKDEFFPNTETVKERVEYWLKSKNYHYKSVEVYTRKYTSTKQKYSIIIEGFIFNENLLFKFSAKNRVQTIIPAFIITKIPTTLVKFFDKQGVEIKNKRKYYEQGNKLLTNIKDKDFVLDCEKKEKTPTVIKSEETKYQPFQEILMAEKTYTDELFSLTFKVKEGTSNVNVNGTTIEYEEGDVITFDGKISSEVLKGTITITPSMNGKVLVVGIKKV